VQAKSTAHLQFSCLQAFCLADTKQLQLILKHTGNNVVEIMAKN